MGELKAYPEYKDSGVEWIGKVPNEWGVTKLKYVSNVIMGQSPDAESINNQAKGLPFLQGNAEFTDLYPKAKHHCLRPKKTSNTGDILLSVRAPVGEMNLSDSIYAIGRGLCSVRAKDTCVQNYLWYQLNCLKKELYSKMTGSTFEAVTTTDVRGSNVILPTYHEQKQISNYLNKQTSEIDSLITDKERLIKLLEEKRQAIITETVTKGLDPDVKMKDSGIEGIGEIPKHWNTRKIRFLGSLQNGISKGGSFFGKGNPFISYSNVYNNMTIKKHTADLLESTDAEKRLYSVKKGDVFFTRTSETAEEIAIASTCLEDIKDATFAGFLIRFRPKKKYLYEGFSKYFFRSEHRKNYFVKEMNLVIRASLSQTLLKNYKVILPLFEEQIEIAQYLDEKNVLYRELIQSIKTQISKIKEYRESLIYEAVTGKIDVRDYATERQEAY